MVLIKIKWKKKRERESFKKQFKWKRLLLMIMVLIISRFLWPRGYFLKEQSRKMPLQWNNKNEAGEAASHSSGSLSCVLSCAKHLSSSSHSCFIVTQPGWYSHFSPFKDKFTGTHTGQKHLSYKIRSSRKREWHRKDLLPGQSNFRACTLTSKCYCHQRVWVIQGAKSVPSKGVLVPIPRACEWVTLYSKRDLCRCDSVEDLRMGKSSGYTSVIMGPCKEAGRRSSSERDVKMFCCWLSR